MEALALVALTVAGIVFIKDQGIRAGLAILLCMEVFVFGLKGAVVFTEYLSTIFGI